MLSNHENRSDLEIGGAREDITLDIYDQQSI